MKIRKSFVTNSSSSSFVLTTDLTLEEVEERLKKLVELCNLFLGEDVSYESLFVDIREADDFQKRKIKNKCEESEYTNKPYVLAAIDKCNVVIYNDRFENSDSYSAISSFLKNTWWATAIPFGKGWVYEDEIDGVS